jgi:hypothetical protein
MAKPKVICRIIVHKPVEEVIRGLKEEGWPVVHETNGRVLFRWDKCVKEKMAKSALN